MLLIKDYNPRSMKILNNRMLQQYQQQQQHPTNQTITQPITQPITQTQNNLQYLTLPLSAPQIQSII